MPDGAALDGAGHLRLTALPSGQPGRPLDAHTGHKDKPFGYTTLLPLARLGMLEGTQCQPVRAVARVSYKGKP